MLLDGLNELPKAFETEIANFRDRYRRTTPMIVSTRDLGGGGTLGIEKTLKMLPLTQPQMQEFVRGYLGEEGDRLFQQLQGDRLRKFAETPLFLWMLCRVFAEECIQAEKEKRPPKLPDLCQALVDIGGESAGKIIHLLSEFANPKTINWLLDALENTERYASDSYFCNRIALVLVRCRPDVVEDKLSHLTRLLTRKYIQQLFWVIPAIQNRCQFYNYDLYQAHLAAQKADRQTHSNSDRPSTTNPVIYDLRGAAIANLAHEVHGNQIAQPE